jgi:hypothetical protein
VPLELVSSRHFLFLRWAKNSECVSLGHPRAWGDAAEKRKASTGKRRSETDTNEFCFPLAGKLSGPLNFS